MALMLIAEGKPAQASDAAWKAWKICPMAGTLGAYVCWTHYLSGDFAQALELTRQVRMSGGNSALLAMVEGLALIQTGVTDEKLLIIEAHASEAAERCDLLALLGCALAKDGKRDQAIEIARSLALLSAQKQQSAAYGLAILHLALGSEIEAVDWLERAFAEGSHWSLGFAIDPILAPMAKSSRFQALLRRLSAGASFANRPGAFEVLSKAI
jgi:tetratricopeptide (TPR) repeat protein